ncbi:MAG: dienelactone hydrolase family protein [Gammaproteobacteria bacterium]|nr:dienelactone hydrolase family protein [Gammaproteobacteria bacterium]
MAQPAAPAAGVLVCMHAPGVDGFIQGICDKLADAGYQAVAPDLYHRQSQPDLGPLERMALLTDVEVLADLEAVWANLLDTSRPRAVVGFCMGGRLSYLWAANGNAVAAAVVFYGGSTAVAWGDGPSPLDQSAAIQAPVLGLFGADDINPSPADVARLDAALTRAGVAHEFKSYAGAGHAFLNDARPSFRPDAAADAWHRCIEFLNLHTNSSMKRNH